MTLVLGVVLVLGVAMAAGPLPALLLGLVMHRWWARRPVRIDPPQLRLVLILLLVELRSGQSVLGSLHRVSGALPEYGALAKVARVASVRGLTGALAHAPAELRPVVSQLARSQASGASLTGTVRQLLEDHLREERSRRLARVRGLPTRLMLPVALLMMPGMVLLLYGPTVVDLYRGLFTTWP